jgi:uncharacterized coiled-coil protein SlyX
VVLSNEELLNLRDTAIDKYRDCRMHIGKAETSLNTMIEKRQNVINQFNDTMFSITKEIDKVKNSKSELYIIQMEIEFQIKELNQLIAERRLDRNKDDWY